MIAPDPALTGRPPAAAARPQAARDAEPRAPRDRAAEDDDFGSVLSGVSKRRGRDAEAPEPAAGREDVPAAIIEAAPVAATPAAPSAETVVAELVAVPVPPALPVPDAPATAQPAAAIVAAAGAAPAAATTGPAIDASLPIAEVTSPEAAPPAAAGPPVAVPQVAAAVPFAIRQIPRLGEAQPEAKDQAADAIAAEAPMLRHTVTPAVVPAAAGAQPAVSLAADGAASGLVLLHEASPASWHLSAAPVAPHAGNDVAAATPQPLSVPPQAVIAQVAVAVGKATDRRVEIRLDPPELGRVQIDLTPIDGGVQAVVLADRPETQDLLRRHAEALARELGAAGFDNVSLDFAAGNEAAPGRDEAATIEHPRSAPLAATVEAPAPVAVRRSLAGGLDVRL